MTTHERAVRKALKAFEPMVPPHVMTALQQVIDGYLKDVSDFEKKLNDKFKGEFTTMGGMSGEIPCGQ